MSYHGEKLYRIDLGTMHEPQACPEHAAKPDDGDAAGYQSDCDRCVRTPERPVPVPHLAGYWVEVQNPDLLSYGRRKEIYPPVPENATAQEIQARREGIVRGLVTAWNLEAAELADGETPEVLPIPKHDAGALDRAPDVIGFVLAGLARERRRQESAVPKASATA